MSGVALPETTSKPLAPASTLDIEHGTSSRDYDGTRFTFSGRIVVLDLQKDGSQSFHPDVPLARQQSISQELPPVPPDAIRILLADSVIYRKPSELLWNKGLSLTGDLPQDDDDPPTEGAVREKGQMEGMARLGSSSSYDDGRELHKSIFVDVKSRSFSVFDLENFWRPQANYRACPFYAQWNVPRKDLDGPQYVRRDKVLEANLDGFFFSDREFVYWEYISTAETQTDKDGGVYATLMFPLLPMGTAKKTHIPFDVTGASAAISVAMNNLLIQLMAPLRLHFLRILSSNDAAVRVGAASSPQFQLQMLSVDYLRAILECWMIFLAALQRDISALVEDDVELVRIGKGSTIPKLKGFRYRLTDLEACADFAIQSALSSLKENDLEAPTSRKLVAIEVVFKAKIKAARTKLDGILDVFVTQADKKTDDFHDSQARSLKRLTMLASFFLPLSLSCGILSMGSRAVDLGFLWYDFVGVSLLLMFVVFAIYFLLASREWVRDLAKAYIHIFSQLEAFYHPTLHRNLRAYTRWLQLMRQAYGIAFHLDTTRRILLLLFSIMVVSSFWVGMFDDMTLGLKILGFGSAASLFLYFLDVSHRLFRVIKPSHGQEIRA